MDNGKMAPPLGWSSRRQSEPCAEDMGDFEVGDFMLHGLPHGPPRPLPSDLFLQPNSRFRYAASESRPIGPFNPHSFWSFGSFFFFHAGR